MSDDPTSILGRYAPDEHGEHVEVHLLNFPLQVFAKAREHHEELLREFALLALSPPKDRPGHHVPRQFLDLINTMGVRYGGIGASTDAIRDESVARGDAAMDLAYTVPRSVGTAMQDLRSLLEQADEFCRDGQMLTMGLAALEREFLWWFIDEFTNQAKDLPPTRWTGAMIPDF